MIIEMSYNCCGVFQVFEWVNLKILTSISFVFVYKLQVQMLCFRQSEQKQKFAKKNTNLKYDCTGTHAHVAFATGDFL